MLWEEQGRRQEDGFIVVVVPQAHAYPVVAEDRRASSGHDAGMGKWDEEEATALDLGSFRTRRPRRSYRT